MEHMEHQGPGRPWTSARDCRDPRSEKRGPARASGRSQAEIDGLFEVKLRGRVWLEKKDATGKIHIASFQNW